jgi:hypothetical protein
MSSSIAFQTLVLNHDIRYPFMERFMAVRQNLTASLPRSRCFGGFYFSTADSTRTSKTNVSLVMMFPELSVNEKETQHESTYIRNRTRVKDSIHP